MKITREQAEACAMMLESVASTIDTTELTAKKAAGKRPKTWAYGENGIAAWERRAISIQHARQDEHDALIGAVRAHAVVGLIDYKAVTLSAPYGPPIRIGKLRAERSEADIWYDHDNRLRLSTDIATVVITHPLAVELMVACYGMTK